MLSRKAQLMCSFRGRMQLAAEAAAAEEAEKKNSLLNDPWFAPTSRLKGRVDWDGQEYITSQQCLDALGVPMHAREGALFRRLTKIMRSHAWEPIRIKLNGVEGGGVIDRARVISARPTNCRTRRCRGSFRAKLTQPRPMSSARLSRGSKWTHVGLSPARCAHL